MNCPERSIHRVNVPSTLNPLSIIKLEEELNVFDASSTKSLLVLQGSEQGIFCLGMDLQWVADSNPAGLQQEVRSFSRLLRSITNMPCITVAFVDGNVVGGGLGIIAACDIVLASSTSHFRLTEGLLGLVPGLILPALQRRLAAHLIKKMVFSSQNYTAAEALSINLVDAIFEANELEYGVAQWLDQLSRCSLQSVKDLKTLLRETNDYSDTSITRAATMLGEALNEQAKRRLRSVAYYNYMK